MHQVSRLSCFILRYALTSSSVRTINHAKSSDASKITYTFYSVQQKHRDLITKWTRHLWWFGVLPPPFSLLLQTAAMTKETLRIDLTIQPGYKSVVLALGQNYQTSDFDSYTDGSLRSIPQALQRSGSRKGMWGEDKHEMDHHIRPQSQCFRNFLQIIGND